VNRHRHGNKMNDAKQNILKRIRSQLAGSSASKAGYDDIPRIYRRKSEKSRESIVKLFLERVDEYKATVKRADVTNIQQVVVESCKEGDAKNIVIPQGLPELWLPENINVQVDSNEHRLTKNQIDGLDAALTGCAVAVAQTGTIGLNANEGQGRRILTLVPDLHICVVKESQIVELLPEAIILLQQDVEQGQRPITFISGPSATSDIELSRVEGVHGPRNLTVIVLNEP